ncbi:hypothetical protein ACSCX3_000872 [Enterobacter hormaechei]
MSSSRKITLQQFCITHVCNEHESNAERITLQENVNYWIKKDEAICVNGQMIKENMYNFLPIILNSDGSPWHQSVLFVLDKAKNDFNYNPATYHCIISDLTNFKNFLDENKIDLYDFPEQKLLRPTYQYRNYLVLKIQSGKLSSQTVKRRVSTMILFYRFLIREKFFAPQNIPWSENEVYINTFDKIGFSYNVKKTKTDLSIKTPVDIDPFTKNILDEGRLRPLELDEQSALIDVLIKLENTEMLLIHLIALFTGARIQTVLTLKKTTFLKDIKNHNTEVRILTGNGTGIDTKRDKNIILILPLWLYEKIRIYVFSKRSSDRVKKSNCHLFSDYLFLSNRGTPYYIGKEHLKKPYLNNNVHTLHNGEAVRQFIKKRVLPLMKEKLNNPGYNYKYHDLRATFGMNLTSSLLTSVEQEKTTLHEAREYVKCRMGHLSSSTTDLYLNYRNDLSNYNAYQESYELYLNKIAEKIWRNET